MSGVIAERRTEMSAPVRIGLLLFPGVTPLDLTGPAEVFARMPGSEVHLVWKTADPVATGAGWRILPTLSFADAPPFDVICVPGGEGQIALMADDETLDFLRRQAAGARYVTSVCTGSLVLGAAGLLVGYRAACHWMSLDQLALLGAIPVAERVVTDGNRITGGGITAGIDFALTVAAELRGAEAACAVQLGMEYHPRPPFLSGSPAQAAPELVARVTQRAADRQARRLAATRAAAARLGLSR
ncbi:MAG: DJ-1/PfpI family protein [Minicystis sp.]